MLTSKLANSPQNFCQQEPFVKTNVTCMSITPSLYRISTAPSQYAEVINKNFAHQYIFIQRSDCYARCDWSLPMIYWSTDKWMTSKLVFFVWRAVLKMFVRLFRTKASEIFEKSLGGAI